MKDFSDFLESGIIELYVMQDTTPAQNAEVEEMAQKYPAIRAEIEAVSLALEGYAVAGAITPDPIIKPFLLAVIDYTTRLENGEPFVTVPELSASSTIGDYAQWIDREEISAPEDFEGVFAKIISAVPDQLLTAVVWLKELAPQEVHDDEFERFLILEGTCDITIEDEVHSLERGGYLQIPLHKNHFVTVTSSVPCKVLLQRVKVAA